ncbi:capsid precursor [Passerine astrovirus 3]|nr:capsid precursor [Passerine astrovirus 3]
MVRVRRTTTTTEAPKPRRPPRRRAKTTTTTTTTTSNGSGGRRRRRRTRMMRIQGSQETEVQMTTNILNARHIRNLQRRMRKIEGMEKGPKVESMLRTTVTIGAINGTDMHPLVKHLRVFMNPTLLKISDAGRNPTPLSTRGSQYTMYKIVSATVHLKPCVGNSMVSGSLFLVDLDLEASAAKPDTIDTIKARPHVEASIGKQVRWNLKPKWLLGPREGWWLVDTSEGSDTVLGPALNFSSYMQTINLMKTATTVPDVTNYYEGPVFMAEIDITYAFSGYSTRPALSQLEIKTPVHNGKQASLENDEAGNLILRTGTAGVFFEHFSSCPEKLAFEAAGLVRTNVQEKSTTVWSVASTAVSAIADVIEPWGWLLRGGWFLVRLLLGQKQKDGSEVCYIYPSVEDAMRDCPIRAKVNASRQGTSKLLPGGDYTIQEVVPYNLEGSPVAPLLYGSVAPPPEPVANSDWLPSEYAVPPDPTPPLTYWYDINTEKNIPGPKQVLVPGSDQGDVDSELYFVGTGIWHCYGVKLPTKTGVAFQVARGFGDKVFSHHSFKVEGSYINFYSYEAMIMAGASDLMMEGLLHTRDTLAKAMHEVLENPTPAGRIGFSDHICYWLEHTIIDKQVEGWWEEVQPLAAPTLCIPCRLNGGSIGIKFEPIGNDALVSNWEADALFVFSPLLGNKAGFVFATDFPANQLNIPMLYLQNVRDKDIMKYKTRIYSISQLEPADSDIETIEEEYVKPKLPEKKRRYKHAEK